MKKRFVLIIIALLLAAAGVMPVSAAIVYVRHHAGPTYNGASWGTAYYNVQDGVNAALAGSEIWVAAGTYTENIALKSGLALYGGFLGTETSKTQRNYRNNLTILDGNWAGSVVEIARNATASTRIDGFTITNGRAVVGGGVYCNQSASPVIANNLITGNSADADGGGIFCNVGSAPTIAGNVISDNGAIGNGGGVCNITGYPVIANNLIFANAARRGGGVSCGDSTNATVSSHEYVINNTIVANSASYGGAIYCWPASSASISNNIVGFNASGIGKQSGYGVPSLKTNCLYSNDGYNYSGLSQGLTDILVDPKLASLAYGNLHIQANSPCKEAGTGAEVRVGYNDIDGQTRISGTVDIGADESNGTTWTVTPTIVRVTPTGSDANDGSSWGSAKSTIQAAIDTASPILRSSKDGGQVWVKAGTYNETITLRDGVYVYGGFDGSETDLSQRNWANNSTIVDGGADGSVVTAAFIGYRVSRIDGFTIRNGKDLNGAGMFIDHASPVVMNNKITSNAASNCGGGIYLANSSALIKSNQITNNSALLWGGGIHTAHSNADITANTIDNNTACISGGGYQATADTTSKLVNNLIIKNGENPASPWVWGAAVSMFSYAPPDLISNTIADNSVNGPAVYCGVFGMLKMRNNIVAYNGYGVWAKNSGIVNLSNNCVFQNGYYGLSAGPGDIFVDPLFANRLAGDYRLLSISPCIDVADPASSPIDDFLGTIRPKDGDANGIAIADMGCFEYFVQAPPSAPTVTGITPSSGTNTGVTNITDLAGTGFQTGATVKLKRTGKTDIAAFGVNVASATKITCSFDLTNKAIGVWDVFVSNTDGQSGTLSQGFGIRVSQTAPTMGTNIYGLLYDQVMELASPTRQVCVWGQAEVINSSTLLIKDASGNQIKIFSPGYGSIGIVNGDTVAATGGIDLSETPPVLISGDIRKYN